ncbi:MAG: hypothetical protein HFE66_00730 [Clostridiales bacterium]|jgi:hypothetical protein|nr:hypothetical protein [Clostridiales bacterium]
MTCSKCGFIYTDTLSACPKCGQTNNIQVLQKSVQALFNSLLFRSICVMVTVTAFLYLCSGRMGLFWILSSIAGWITCAKKASPEKVTAGLRLYSITLKCLHYVMLALAGLLALLSVAILIIGSFTGDTWLAYLAGVSTEYGTGIIPVAALGRLLDTVVSFGGIVAVASACITLLAIAAAIFFLTKLLIPIRYYLYGLLNMAAEGKPMPAMAVPASVCLVVFGVIQGLSSLTYISLGNGIAIAASFCAAASLFATAWLIRK